MTNSDINSNFPRTSTVIWTWEADGGLVDFPASVTANLWILRPHFKCHTLKVQSVVMIQHTIDKNKSGPVAPATGRQNSKQHICM